MTHRSSLPRLAAVASLAAMASCAGSRSAAPLEPQDPSQAAGGAPGAAAAEVAGVQTQVEVGHWRGRPPDLEQRLTPVDVVVQNASGRPVRLGPESFALVVGDRRLRALDRREVNRALADLTGFRRPPPPRAGTGAVGGPTFPGYDAPGDPNGPGSRQATPVPPAGQWYASQLPSGTLANGARTAVLLFFDAPARGLTRATFELDVVADDGTRLGTIRIPYGRG
jgi:hypothetical protein